MKTTRKTTAILIALLIMVSILASCSKEDNGKETDPKTTVMAGNEDASEVQSTIPGGTIENSNAAISSSTKAGDIIQFGQYEQDNSLSNGKEKIAWRVLTVENGKAFVLADKVLDAKPYNVDNKNVTWEICTLRTWLNNDFYNAAFTTEEKTKILTTDVVNEDNPNNGTEGGNNTKEKVFLLSLSEATNPNYGFILDMNNADFARQAQGSDFAKSNGLNVSSDNPYLGNCDWWLRSPGYDPYVVGVINNEGYVSDFNNADSTYIGVRPAIWINL